MDAERQVYETTIRQLRALLAAQERLRKAAEGMAREARRELERVAEALCPEEVDRLRVRSPQGLADLSSRQVGEMVLRGVRGRLARLEATVRVDPEEVLQLREEVERLRREVRRLEVATSKATLAPPPVTTPPTAPVVTEGSGQAATGVTTARRVVPPPPWVAEAMERMQPAPPEPAVSVEAWPGWAKTWREASPNLERDLDVVLVLGDTGIPRRRDLAFLLAKRWGIRPGGGGISRAISRAREAGLVEHVVPERETKVWRPGHLVRLTERGEDLYRLVRGKDPVPAQATLLLNRHKSPEHTALNLAIAEMLARAGYRVDILPGEVEAEEGVYRPDLAATLNGDRLYVEGERHTWKNPVERARKWKLYHQATGGRFAIGTFSAAAAKAIQEEIETWAREERMPVDLWMTDLERGPEAGRGEKVWVVRLRVE